MVFYSIFCSFSIKNIPLSYNVVTLNILPFIKVDVRNRKFNEVTYLIISNITKLTNNTKEHIHHFIFIQWLYIVL